MPGNVSNDRPPVCAHRQLQNPTRALSRQDTVASADSQGTDARSSNDRSLEPQRISLEKAGRQIDPPCNPDQCLVSRCPAHGHAVRRVSRQDELRAYLTQGGQAVDSHDWLQFSVAIDARLCACGVLRTSAMNAPVDNWRPRLSRGQCRAFCRAARRERRREDATVDIACPSDQLLGRCCRAAGSARPHNVTNVVHLEPSRRRCGTRCYKRRPSGC